MNVQHRRSLEPAASRRAFLRNSALAASGVAAFAGVTHAADDPESPPDPQHAVDVRQFGARGDGETDDTTALRDSIEYARCQGISTILLPAGTYVLGGTVRLPSNVTLRGQGPGLTTLQAQADTRFDKFKPDPRTADIRQRRTMITTEAVSTVRESVTKHAGVKHLTLDWNHCPTDRFGHSVVLADSCDHFTLDNVHFINCLPSDHPRSIEEMSGSAFRCECVMYCNAHDGLLHRCHLTDSGYRPLSVSYNSQRIYFINGAITATKPVWRHVFSENHGDGLPRDDTFLRSQLIFLNSTFTLEGGTGQDGICSHTGTTHVENCDFYIKGGLQHFSMVLRPFDASQDCRYINNRFHCDHDLDSHFAIFSTSGGQRADNENLTFAGNIVRMTFADLPSGPRRACLAFLPTEDRNVRIADNHAVITFKGRTPLDLIKIQNNTSFTIAGNTVDVRLADPDIDRVPNAITIEDSTAGQVINNAFIGSYHHGLSVTGKSDRLVLYANNLADATAEEAIHIDAPGQILAEHNLT